MKKIILFLLLTSCIFSKNSLINSSYKSGRMDTLFIYKFKKKGDVFFKIDGHMGHTEIKGFYLVKKDSIFMKFDPKWEKKWGTSFSKMKILNESCIKDNEGHLYCRDIRDTFDFY